MRYFIHSTLSNPHIYTQWTRPSDQNMSPEIIGTPVRIEGGANIATSPESKKGRYTPKGVMTEVTEAQMDYLEGSTKFKKHKARGYIIVTQSKEDPEDIARDMKPKDNSAPLTPDSPELNKPDGPKAMKDGVSVLLDKMKNAVS
jgi:hypothetical protein